MKQSIDVQSQYGYRRIRPDGWGYGRTLVVATFAALFLLTAFFRWSPAFRIAPYRLADDPIGVQPELEFVRLLSPAVRAAESDRVIDAPDAAAPLAPPAIDAGILDAAHSVVWPARRPELRSRSRLYAFEPLPPGSGRPLFRMTPSYGPLPLGLDLDKTVVVKVKVSSGGNVVDAHVSKGVSYSLDKQALMAAWQCRLSPSGENHEGRGDWVTLPYEFLLEP